MSGPDKTPADVVRSTIYQWCEDQFGRDLGMSRGLRDLRWSDEMPDDDPFATWEVVDKDGTRFEVEIEVDVTELTAKVLAERSAFVERMQKLQGQHARAAVSE